MNLGTLEFLPATEHQAMLAKPVITTISTLTNADVVGVSAIDPSLSDTAGFCEHYQVTPEQAANCVIVEGKYANGRKLAELIILASTRADVNGAVRSALGAKKVSFASMDKAVEESHIEFGAISPM